MRSRALALTGMVLIFLFCLAFWLLAFYAVRGYADTQPPETPPQGYTDGSTTWLNDAASQVAGHPKAVFCVDTSKPENAWLRGYDGVAITGRSPIYDTQGNVTGYGPMWGWQALLPLDECMLLWHPRGAEAWWLAGHAAAALGHELAHLEGWCGDDVADAFGLLHERRLLNTQMATEGIRVRPWQRRQADQGALNEMRGPSGRDPVNPGCRDYQPPTLTAGPVDSGTVIPNRNGS